MFSSPLHSQTCPVTIVMPDKYLMLNKCDPIEVTKGQPTYTTSVCRGPQEDKFQSQRKMKQLLGVRSSVDEEYFQVLSNGQSWAPNSHTLYTMIICTV